MWPKIHSNRGPRDTVFAELRKEFGNYFKMVSEWLQGLLEGHPKKAFYSMIALLLISLALSFTLFRNREQPVAVHRKPLAPFADGFGQLMQATGKIRETIMLKQQIDSLSAVKVLTAQDSTRLTAALDRLQRLSKP